jgi:NAD(P)H dehydrogenase (quinone)
VNIYVVYCHPNSDSFTAEVRQRTVEAFEAAGHRVRISDLYADGFSPVMSRDEWLNHLAPRPEPQIVEYCDTLQWCDTLVLVYPTWWSGQPAMLTGWLDRVLIRGVAWELPDGKSRIAARLTNIRRVMAITTHGSSRLVNVAEGETGRRVISRAVRVLCNRFAHTTWLAMYDIDRSTAADRDAFLNRVERRIKRLSPPRQPIGAGRKW